MAEQTQGTVEKPSLLSNILAIIGLIILVIIIVWGLVHLAELSSGWFSSLFEKSASTIQIDAPSDAVAGAPVSVSWQYSTSATGTYAFLYQCQNGLQFALINTANNTASGIPCGAAFNVTPVSNGIQLLPLLSGTTSASVPFTIIFTPTTGAAVEGSATITIHPGSSTAPSAPSQPAKTTATQSAPSTSYSARRSYAPADLAVTITAESVDQYGNGIVTFNVSNIGGSRSGSYYFSAQLPTSSPAPYTSSLQAPLAAGGYIVDTLRFTQAVSGTFSVALQANDYNQNNDYASKWVNATPSYYGNGYNTNYNQYTGPTGNYTQYQTYPYTY